MTTRTVPRELIVTADDLGYCATRDRGIIAAHTHGVVTCASVLANGRAAATAVASACAAGLSIGLHLNLTEGNPVAPADAVPSLLAPCAGTGGERVVFRGKHGFRDALAAGDVSLAEGAVEIRAQLARYAALHAEAARTLAAAGDAAGAARAREARPTCHRAHSSSIERRCIATSQLDASFFFAVSRVC